MKETSTGTKKRIKLFTFGRTDITLAFGVVFLMAFGVLMVFSASYYESYKVTDGASHYYYGNRQLIWAGISLTVMLMVSLINYKFIAKFWGVIYIGNLILQIVVLVMGNNKSGRWFDFGGVGFQPSELTKLAVILTLAVSLNSTKKHMDKFRMLAINLGLLAVPTGLTMVADLSTGIVTGAIGLAMIFISVPKWKALFKYVLIAAAILFAGYTLFKDFFFFFLKDYQTVRLRVFFEGPWSDPSDSGYQTIQSLYAIGSGGFFGKGLGYSMQKNGFIPEAHNDIIFAVICEELGFFGAVAVMLLFAIVIWRCVIVVMGLKDTMGILIVTGVLTQIASQIIINVSVVTNKLPATGMPLPFISYGGSSLLFLATSIGIVLNIARHRE